MNVFHVVFIASIFLSVVADEVVSPTDEPETVLDTLYEKYFPDYLQHHNRDLMKKNALHLESIYKVLIKALNELLQQYSVRPGNIVFPETFLNITFGNRSRIISKKKIKDDILDIKEALVESLADQGVELYFKDENRPNTDFDYDALPAESQALRSQLKPTNQTFLLSFYKKFFPDYLFNKDPELVPKNAVLLEEKFKIVIKALNEKLKESVDKPFIYFKDSFCNITVDDPNGIITREQVNIDIDDFKEALIEILRHQGVDLDVVDENETNEPEPTRASAGFVELFLPVIQKVLQSNYTRSHLRTVLTFLTYLTKHLQKKLKESGSNNLIEIEDKKILWVKIPQHLRKLEKQEVRQELKILTDLDLKVRKMYKEARNATSALNIHT